MMFYFMYMFFSCFCCILYCKVKFIFKVELKCGVFVRVGVYLWYWEKYFEICYYI